METRIRELKTIKPEELRETIKTLKVEGFNFLSCISAYDLPKKNSIALVYSLSKIPEGERVDIKTEISRDLPKISTVSDIFPAAEWHEREAYDLLGVIFDGHPDLRRILLPEDWEGHPLRKDYRIPETYRWIDNRRR